MNALRIQTTATLMQYAQILLVPLPALVTMAMMETVLHVQVTMSLFSFTPFSDYSLFVLGQEKLLCN